MRERISTVLVTGGSGFIGRHLVARLLREKTSVRVLARSPRIGFAGSDLEWRSGDIRDKSQVLSAMQGVETIFHAAALVPGKSGNGDYWETNVEGTRNVVKAGLLAGVKRIVFVSSIAVYAAPFSPVIDEAAPLGGVDGYGKSKCAAEEVVRNLCAGKAAHAILRPCQVYGPEDVTGYTGRLLSLSRLPILPLPSGPAPVFSLLHVEDLIEALLRAAEFATPAGGAYNISGETRTSLEEIAGLARGKARFPQVQIRLPNWSIRSLGFLKWHARNLRAGKAGLRFDAFRKGAGHGSMILGGPAYGTEKARNELGFRPAITVRQGVARLVEGPK